MPVVFALDVGEKRIGIAKSDELGIIAAPFGFIDRANSITNLQNLFEQEKAEKLVIGMPYLPSGGLGSQADDVKTFAQELEGVIKLPIVFESEVLTSIEAEKRLRESKKEFQKGDIDEMAAVIILETYLRRGENAFKN